MNTHENQDPLRRHLLITKDCPGWRASVLGNLEASTLRDLTSTQACLLQQKHKKLLLLAKCAQLVYEHQQRTPPHQIYPFACQQTFVVSLT